MRKLGMTAASLFAVTAFAGNSADQAYFAIFAETKMMKVAGMEDIDIPEGVPIPAGVPIPGKATRGLEMRLWSPTIAPGDATASVVPPAGLKVGPKLDLELYRPSPDDEKTGGGGGAPGGDPQKFTIKVYWGSSATVREGQPKIITWGNLTPEQMAAMKRQQQQANPRAMSSYFYKPNWTTGYWPTKRQPAKIDKNSSLVGSYALTTNYTGNVTLDVPAGVDFLDPISITAPDLKDEIALDKAIPFQWKAIPNSLGQFASIFGMEGKNTLIIWTSSEVFNEMVMGESAYLQMAEVRDRVAQKLFMPGDQTSMTVPAGIFKGTEAAMMNMVAYGPGAATDNTQPLPRLQTKSTLMLMLAGMGH